MRANVLSISKRKHTKDEQKVEKKYLIEKERYRGRNGQSIRDDRSLSIETDNSDSLVPESFGFFPQTEDFFSRASPNPV